MPPGLVNSLWLSRAKLTIELLEFLQSMLPIRVTLLLLRAIIGPPARVEVCTSRSTIDLLDLRVLRRCLW